MRTGTFAAALVLVACAKEPAPAEVVRVGVIAGLTGPSAELGGPALAGVRLALADARLVSGRTIELVVEDDEGLPARARAHLERLVGEARIDALLGPIESASALEVAPLAARAGLVSVAPAATHPAVLAAGPSIFRTCYGDDEQAEALAAVATEHLAAQRIAVLVDVGVVHSVGLGDAFAAALVARGRAAPAREGFAEIADLEPALARLRSVAPDLLFLPIYGRDVPAVVSAARAAGLYAGLLGADGWASGRLLSLRPLALEGAVFTGHFVESGGASAGAFAERFRAAMNEPADGFAALGYDAARWLFGAIDRADVPRGEALRRQLHAEVGFAGATGAYELGPDRRPLKEIPLFRFAGGRARPLGRFDPRTGRLALAP